MLVTGGAGYVGSVLCGRLLEAGHEVRAFDALRFGGRSLLHLYSRPSFEFVRGDVRSPADVEHAVAGVDAVVHLAAIVGDPACARDPELARETNLEGAFRLAERSREEGVQRFIFASTCSNYGKMDASLEYVAEDSVLSPLSLYAETKVGVERELLGYEDPAFVVLRFATVFGLSPRMRLDLTVNQFAVELLTRRRLVVYGEQFWRPYIHVRDAADAMGAVLEADEHVVGGDVFNVGGTAENYTKADILELVSEQLEGKVEIERVTVAEDPRDYKVSFEKIRQRLGFEPSLSVRDGIHEVLDATAKGVLGDIDDPGYRN